MYILYEYACKSIFAYHRQAVYICLFGVVRSLNYLRGHPLQHHKKPQMYHSSHLHFIPLHSKVYLCGSDVSRHNNIEVLKSRQAEITNLKHPMQYYSDCKWCLIR